MPDIYGYLAPLGGAVIGLVYGGPVGAVVGGVSGFVASRLVGAAVSGAVGLAGAELGKTEAANLIMSEFGKAGFHQRVGKAAVVNAWHESALVPDAVGDGGKAVGLFQIHDVNKAKFPAGFDRKDPLQNIRWIIRAEGSGLAAINARARSGAGIGELSSMFGQLIERCATCQPKQAQYIARGKTGELWYPADKA